MLPPPPALRPLTARPQGRLQRRFLVLHAGLPLAGLALASALLIGLQLDQWLADALFRLEGGHWMLRHAWITEQVLHRGGRLLSTLAWLLVALALLRTWLHPVAAPLRRALACLLLAVALSSTTIALLKHASGVHCPWDIARYGGAYATARLADAAAAPGACFPAGHAGAGYAWVALYFAALLYRPHWRWWGMGIGLIAGLAFGLAQQLRGAHFLSHDVWSLAICWLVSLALYLGMRGATSGHASASGHTAETQA
ncbi:phosphatase PAP2 family protein [Xanthomonas sp. XNM01]|uniref:phosphatase PAP2 family protein n=1 Tax=Xanthomonas sp. XNM01 TaxID=2769289 RepID=UPI0017835F18|nr:phosphatase PAP2 family protein [Xanthomonas sp. XNM01]MBD9368649.1 phosphatase PAP2 family protein [Xanthomonas sp. XNM01]